MKSNLIILLILSVVIVSCTSSSSPTNLPNNQPQAEALPEKKSLKAEQMSPLEKQMIKQGLINIQTIDPDIRVELKYSTTDNFVGKDVYGDLTAAYLQPEMAKKLAKANQVLQANKPGYSLLVYDAARPNSVQYILWDALDAMKIPAKNKPQYVADPKIGSIHNFGCAVDLTVADAEGVPLDMGTPYDFFGPLAYPRMELQLLREEKLTSRQVANRQVLREAMVQAGFSVNPTEWWHFDGMSRNAARSRYGMIK